MEEDPVEAGVERGQVDPLPGEDKPQDVSQRGENLSTENKYKLSQQNSVQEKYLQHKI